MAALTREFPDLKLTFNLVPSLLVQLEAFAAGQARDRHLEVGLAAADTLSDADRLFCAEHFFHAHRARMIDPFPRYAELLAAREAGRRHGNPAGAFTTDDLRDLQVWHKLVWIDPIYADRDPRVRALFAKGRDFSEQDKQTLRIGGAGDSRPGRVRVSRRRRAGADRDLRLAVLPPDPAAAVRRVGVPHDPSLMAAAGAAVRLSAGCRRAAPARGRAAPAPVRTRAGRPLAVGRIGLGRDGPARGGGRIRLDGHRRGDPGALAAAHLRARRRPLPAVQGRRSRRRRAVRVPRSPAVRSRRLHLLDVGSGTRPPTTS